MPKLPKLITIEFRDDDNDPILLTVRIGLHLDYAYLARSHPTAQTLLKLQAGLLEANSRPRLHGALNVQNG